VSAHKVYGPKGVGALYRRRSNPRVNLEPRIYGGGQERGIRSGTLNVPGIVGLGEAMQIAHQEMGDAAAQCRSWTQQMYRQLEEEIQGIQLNGHPTGRLPSNLNVSIPDIDARALVMNLKNTVVSTGSACSAASLEPSHVILALGHGEERAHSAIRIGVGRSNDDDQIALATARITGSVERLRALRCD
ncbi:MAG: cysteine desulfurase family protein, partial [bacterium]